jgi:hypothetical protein
MWIGITIAVAVPFPIPLFSMIYYWFCKGKFSLFTKKEIVTMLDVTAYNELLLFTARYACHML